MRRDQSPLGRSWGLLSLLSVGALLALGCGQRDGSDAQSGVGGGDAGRAGPPPCLAEGPEGSAVPPPFPTFAGQCPALEAAPGRTRIVSSGETREFLVVTPGNPVSGERWPLVFAWHWLSGSATQLSAAAQLQAAADHHRFVAVVPEAKGDLPFRWPFSSLDSETRLEEELRFFDDMLACVAQALPQVHPACVSSMGLSAGALFSAQLVPRRADRFASWVSLSGGVGGAVRPWLSPARSVPALVLWGGASDQYGGLLNFDQTSRALEDALVADGTFLVECIHNCGHTVPPFAPSPGSGLLSPVWRFVLDHPYWLRGGESPYQSGLPAEFPGWCGVGKGGAAPRDDAAPCF